MRDPIDEAMSCDPECQAAGGDAPEAGQAEASQQAVAALQALTVAVEVLHRENTCNRQSLDLLLAMVEPMNPRAVGEHKATLAAIRQGYMQELLEKLTPDMREQIAADIERTANLVRGE